MNELVCASHIQHYSDYECVRLYTGEGELVPKLLFEMGLATASPSFSAAIEAAIPDVKVLIPNHTPLRTASFEILPPPALKGKFWSLNDIVTEYLHNYFSVLQLSPRALLLSTVRQRVVESRVAPECFSRLPSQ